MSFVQESDSYFLGWFESVSIKSGLIFTKILVWHQLQGEPDLVVLLIWSKFWKLIKYETWTLLKNEGLHFFI